MMKNMIGNINYFSENKKEYNILQLHENSKDKYFILSINILIFTFAPKCNKIVLERGVY